MTTTQKRTIDGGVLEISINGGSFVDIIAAGGVFESGGYNGSIPNFGNPLSGRSAWTGDSGGYIDTVVKLPPTAIGQNVQYRWRFGSDESIGDVGWRIDTIQTCGISSAPRVESVVINDGADSRSQITSLRVVFDTEVDHTALQSAFDITNIDTAVSGWRDQCQRDRFRRKDDGDTDLFRSLNIRPSGNGVAR